MERLIYEAPDGDLIIQPTPEQLAAIIRHAGHEYWQRGGDGEAAIRVAKRHDDGRNVSHAVILRDGTKVEYAAGQPELWIKQPEPERFFLTWDCHQGPIVPYDGSGCEAFVMDERGGNPFKIPRACLVAPAEAVETVREFLQSRGRSKVVRWLSWYELPLPADWDDYL
ncbi:MAG TPA: hypothetical protein VF278_25050 [Pirellulales bacterium]